LSNQSDDLGSWELGHKSQVVAARIADRTASQRIIYSN